ncbi:MAG: endolytic transglycosylase MltG [Oscillospiraceae bacterium]|nr:endolytic transglycosylase MltG [Oscillospiraceae bacterium]
MDTKAKYKDHSELALDDILNSFPQEPGDEESLGEALPNSEVNAEPISEPVVEAKEKSEYEYEHEYEYDDNQSDEVYDEYDQNYEEEQVGEHYVKPSKIKKRRGGAGTSRLMFGLILAAVIIGTSVFLAVNIIHYSQELMGLGRSDVEIVVEIPYGSNTAQIAQILFDEGIIEEQWLFIFFSKVRGTDGSYISGVHSFTPKMSYGDLVDELMKVVESPRESADVVFPEGISLIEAGRRLEEKGICDADEFVRVFNSASFDFSFEELVEDTPLKFFRMEGYLFPDTYKFFLDEDPLIVSRKIYANFANKITPDIYGRMSDLGLTLEETLILASIVQAEVPFKSDMRRVSSVFWNRLNSPTDFPLLQSDPTRKYVREVIEPNVEIRSEAMFAAYDTYQSAGLPPGPIGNPGLDAINAVLFPTETDYFFFCANIETRETFFAKTYAEHNENLVKAGIVLD